MELSRTLFAPGPRLSLSGPPSALLRLPGVPFRGSQMFRRAAAFHLGLVLLLARGHGVCFGLLAVSGNLIAKPLALKFALASALR